MNVNWKLILGIFSVTLLLFMLVLTLKKAAFEIILPLLLIGFVGYLLYGLLMAFSNKRIKK